MSEQVLPVTHRFNECDEVVVRSTGRRATICETREDIPDEYMVEYWPPYDGGFDNWIAVVPAWDLIPWTPPAAQPQA